MLHHGAGGLAEVVCQLTRGWAHHLRRTVPYSQATGGEHGAGGFAPHSNFRVPLRGAAAGLGVEAFPGPVATSQSSLPTAAGDSRYRALRRAPLLEPRVYAVPANPEANKPQK